MTRPSSTAATMVAKLSSARTMSAASLLTSVPVMPMATPMSASLSAGASLTPSPGEGHGAELLEPRARERPAVVGEDPDASADGLRGQRVVARDHDRCDP